MILTGSRYMGQPIASVPTATSGPQNAVFGAQPGLPGTFSYYTIKQGDRLDTIAAAIYGIPDYWWRIANANPEVFYPENLTPGAIIRLPMS